MSRFSGLSPDSTRQVKHDAVGWIRGFRQSQAEVPRRLSSACCTNHSSFRVHLSKYRCGRPGRNSSASVLPPNALGQTSTKSLAASVLRTVAVIGLSTGRPSHVDPSPSSPSSERIAEESLPWRGQHVEEAVAVGLDQHLASCRHLQVDQHRIVDRVVVVRIAGREFVVPDDLSCRRSSRAPSRCERIAAAVAAFEAAVAVPQYTRSSRGRRCRSARWARRRIRRPLAPRCRRPFHWVRRWSSGATFFAVFRSQPSRKPRAPYSPPEIPVTSTPRRSGCIASCCSLACSRPPCASKAPCRP